MIFSTLELGLRMGPHWRWHALGTCLMQPSLDEFIVLGQDLVRTIGTSYCFLVQLPCGRVPSEFARSRPAMGPTGAMLCPISRRSQSRRLGWAAGFDWALVLLTWSWLRSPTNKKGPPRAPMCHSIISLGSDGLIRKPGSKTQFGVCMP